MAPAALVIGLVRPAALLALVLLAVFAGGVARVGLWLVGDRDAGASDFQAVRVGAGVFAGSVAVAAIVLALGPASVAVVAVLAVVVAASVATRLRPPGPPLRGQVRPRQS
ncbi:MAG: hypothetical protein M3235_13325 [Actinomycetota bacterium]|nr:hypothetical protein [Actinomycetota bacterium]